MWSLNLKGRNEKTNNKTLGNVHIQVICVRRHSENKTNDKRQCEENENYVMSQDPSREKKKN